ncbi:cytochrome P450 [Dendrothele bispora CBS 962.96]|uniref:Cytochrome P450 n=1 Tax=Dendrothele bispora (strain CBS 962.96) TaxID=1314807 RepID=A0A4S8LSA7_DENBC|nr:cytochrome P450 [Dendrothele bispora CBS 962.96]
MTTIACALCVWICVRIIRIGRREPNLPPGPPTVPVLGNIHIFPIKFAFFRLTEWARKYGDIYSIKIGPKTIIVLSSMKAVKELIDQQSGLTCDRPKSYMADTMHEGLFTPLVGYNELWRRLRKTMHTILTPNGAAAHQSIQAAEATQLMHDMLHSPELYFTHIERYSTSVIASIVFGKHFTHFDCPEMDAIFKSIHTGVKVLEPGAHPPIDQVPILNYIPERWAKWKRLAKRGNRLASHIYLHMLSICEQRIQRGEENGCFLEDIIKNKNQYELSRRQISFLGGALLDGGAHTTSAFLQSLVLCLTAFPDTQKKAQAEIDKVIGLDRVPQLEDFARLPYCSALINEMHRFRIVGPLGIPHATLDDGMYRDYFLPKESLIFINSCESLSDIVYVLVVHVFLHAGGIYHEPGWLSVPRQLRKFNAKYVFIIRLI